MFPEKELIMFNKKRKYLEEKENEQKKDCFIF